MSAGNERTEVRTAILGQRVVIERRTEDGMVWLRIGETVNGAVPTVALDKEEAWAVAQAMVSEAGL